MSISDSEKFANLVNALNEVVSKLDRLEARLETLERAVLGKSEEVRSVELPPLAMMEPAAIPFVEAPTAEEGVIEKTLVEAPALETKVGLTVLNRIGVVTLVLGVGFFFKWAVDNNWVGPAGRVVLGLLVGFAALGIADGLWRKRQQVFAQGITGAGIAIVYISIYAAFDFYHLMPQALSFALLLMTTAMAATLAFRYNAIAIAALGFFGAYLIPLLLSNEQDRPWFLLTYLLLINVAATELAKRRTWKALELLSFAATVLIFGSWLFRTAWKPEDHLVGTVGVLALCAQRFRTSWPILFVIAQFLTAFSIAIIWTTAAATFAPLAVLVAGGGLAFAAFREYPLIVPTSMTALWVTVWFTGPHTAACMPAAVSGFLLFFGWSWWRSIARQQAPDVVGMSAFALNGVVFYAICYSVLSRQYHHLLGLLAVAVAASYLAFGVFLQRKSKVFDADMVLLALGVSVAFLTLAIPIQLTGFSVTIAWAIQATALSWIGYRLQRSTAVIGGLVVLGLAFLRLVAVDSAMYPNAAAYTFLLNARFLVVVVLASGLLLSAYWVSKVTRELALVHFIAGHLVMLGGCLLEVIGWAERHALRQNLLSEETIGTTILFALYAVLLVSLGVAQRSRIARLSGLVLTALVILKLYFFDVWQLGRVYQIVAFVILGVLLLSTSFLYSRFKGLIESLRKDEKASL